MTEWRDISEAPKKDGETILGWGWYSNTRTWARALISWSEWAECWQANSLPFVAAHFMPLPEPPK